MAHAYNPSAWEAEAGDQKPQVSLGPMARSIVLEKQDPKNSTGQNRSKKLDSNSLLKI
jgi:hypothetical protein